MLHQIIHQDSAPISSWQLKLVGETVLDHLHPQKSTGWIKIKRLVPYLSTVLGIGLIITLVLLRDHNQKFQARGLSAVTGLGIQAICVASDPTGQPWIRAVYPENIEKACKLGDILTFSYTNVKSDGSAGYSYLFLFGVDEQGHPLWYYPNPQEQESIAIDTDAQAINRPLPGGIKLAVNHKAGRIRVYGLFSDSPLSIRRIKHRLDELKQENVSPFEVESIGIMEGKEVSFIIFLED